MIALRRLLFFLFCSVVIASSAFADHSEKNESYEPKYYGNDGFIFFIIQKGNGDFVYSGNPNDHSPLYQGIKTVERIDPKTQKKTKQELRVSSSYKTLKTKGHLQDFPLEGVHSPYLFNGASVSLTPTSMVHLLQYLQKHPQVFANLFSGMTKSKEELFRSLLFDRELVIDANTLQELQRSESNPEPAPLILPFEVPVTFPSPSDQQQQHLTPKMMAIGLFIYALGEMFNDIQIEKMTFSFSKKELTFNPAKNEFTAVLYADTATMEGRVHQIGRIKSAFEANPELESVTWKIPFLNRTPSEIVEFFDKQKRLEKGMVGPLALSFSFRFGLEDEAGQDISGLKHEQPGYWRISLTSDLNLDFGADPRVQLQIADWPDGKGVSSQEVPPTPLPLKPKVQEQIRTTLLKTLQGAFSTAFFPEDLGFRIPITSPKSETDDADLRLEGRLSNVRVTNNDLEMDFDSRISVLKASRCVPPEQLNAILRSTPTNSDPEESSSVGKTWSLKPESGVWQTDHSGPSIHKIHLSSGFIDQLSKAAYLSGALCPSTRSIWPRPAFVSLYQYFPHGPPALNFAQDQLKLSLDGEVESLVPTASLSGASFIPDPKGEKFPFGFGLTLKSNVADRELLLQDFQISKSRELNETENFFLSHLVEVLLERAGFQEKAQLGYHKLESYLDKKTDPDGKLIEIKELRILPDGLNATYDPLDYSWVGLKIPEKPVQEPPKKMETSFFTLPPKRTSDPYIVFEWKQSHPEEDEPVVYYRSRLISSSNAAEKNPWKDWSPFSRDSRTTFHLNRSDRYTFELQTMNPKFEIAPEPLVWDFYYEASTPVAETKLSETPNVDQQSSPAGSSTSNTKTEASSSSNKKKDKGFFGCSLAPSTVERTSFVSLWLNLGFFLSVLIWIRRQGRSSKGN